MTTKQPVGATVSETLPPDYIMPDPPKTPDMRQRRQITKIDAALLAHFKARGDVLVCGEGYLRHDATNASERFAPDCVVTFGVDPEATIRRNGYVVSEVGKPPDFVLEIASKSTGTRDYTVKREGYERYRAREYWRSDESGGRWHDAALAGDKLVDGKYVPIEIIHDEDGRFWGYSEVLGLNLCWDEGILRFYDPVSERFLPDSVELAYERDDAEARSHANKTRADDAEARADDAEARSRANKARADDAEARSRADKARADDAEARSRADKARADDAEARLRELLKRIE